MSNNGLDAFKKRPSSKFAAFPQPGATVAGVITEISDQKHATKYNRDPKAPKELDYWKSGDPKMEVWLTLQTQDRDPQDPEDNGFRTIVVTVNQKPGGQLAAIMDACEAVGAETPLPGGFLVLTFTGFDPQSDNPQNPRKLFAAQYKSPAPGGGAFQQQTAPAQQVQPQYNEWNPAPPAPVQQAPAPHFQGANAAAYPTPEMQAVQQQPPAWAQQPAPQQYQPPVQVNPGTGEVAEQPAVYQQPQAAQQQPPVQQYQQPAPVQQQTPQQGGGVDAVQVQQLIAQGMDDATIQQATGAPAAAIAAIRAIS